MSRQNATVRAAQAAGCHGWTRLLEASKTDALAATGQGPGRTGDRRDDVVITMRVPTLRQLVGEYAERLKLGADKTRRHQTTILNQAIAALPARPTPADVRAWLHRRIIAGGIVGSTANAYLQVVARCYAVATETHALPNPMRAVERFPVAVPVPRALPGDEVGGRAAIVEKLQGLACRNDVERALVAVLYDAGLRIEEATALRIGLDVDPTGGVLWVRGQRDPHAHAHDERTKTRGSNARVNLSPEAAEWIRRALRAPERAKWGGPWKGAAARAALAAEFLFPFTQRGLDNLLRRMRGVVPGAFPRGTAWHTFRHSLASDMDDVRDEGGRRVYSQQDIGERLRHTHGEWTRLYMDRLRGRECATDLDALRGHRQRLREASREGSNVVGFEPRNIKHKGGGSEVGAATLESQACGVQSAAGSWLGSTHYTHQVETHHPAPADASRGSLPLALPPYPVTPRPRRASTPAKGKRGAR